MTCDWTWLFYEDYEKVNSDGKRNICIYIINRECNCYRFFKAYRVYMTNVYNFKIASSLVTTAISFRKNAFVIFAGYGRAHACVRDIRRECRIHEIVYERS